MSKPKKVGYSAPSMALYGLLLFFGLAVVISRPWLLAALPGALVLVVGTTVLLRRREVRRLNRWIDERCEGCGYDLRGIGRSGRCPECGKTFHGVGPVGASDDELMNAGSIAWTRRP